MNHSLVKPLLTSSFRESLSYSVIRVVFCVGRWSVCCSFISWVVRWFVCTFNGSFLHSLGEGGRLFIRLCSLGGRFVLRFVLSLGRSFFRLSFFLVGHSFLSSVYGRLVGWHSVGRSVCWSVCWSNSHFGTKEAEIMVNMLF